MLDVAVNALVRDHAEDVETTGVFFAAFCGFF